MHRGLPPVSTYFFVSSIAGACPPNVKGSGLVSLIVIVQMCDQGDQPQIRVREASAIRVEGGGAGWAAGASAVSEQPDGPNREARTQEKQHGRRSTDDLAQPDGPYRDSTDHERARTATTGRPGAPDAQLISAARWRREMEHSTIEDIGAPIESSVVGRNARIGRVRRRPNAYRLTLGDYSCVEMP